MIPGGSRQLRAGRGVAGCYGYSLTLTSWTAARRRRQGTAPSNPNESGGGWLHALTPGPFAATGEGPGASSEGK